MEVWMRLGVVLDIEEKEMDILFGDDPIEAKQVLIKALDHGNYRVDGNSYIPEISIEEVNRVYKKNYEESDIDFDL